MPKITKRKGKFSSDDIEDMEFDRYATNGLEKVGNSKLNMSIHPDDSDEKKSSEEDVTKVVGDLVSELTSKRKKMTNMSSDVVMKIQHKLKDVMDKQAEIRRKGNDQMIRSLSSLLTQMEEDHCTITVKEQKIQDLATSLLKLTQQDKSKHSQRLMSLKEFRTAYQKQVEGLLLRGAMKPEDRPVWFDVYRQFPPAEEPKFARKKPDAKQKPIKKIFYAEDEQRAKFQSAGHGIGTFNMLNQSGDTQIKKLIKHYEILKTEVTDEEELITKAVQAAKEETVQAYENYKSTSIPSQAANEKPKQQNSSIKNIFQE